MNGKNRKPDAVLCTYNAKYVHASLAPWCLLAGVRQYAPDLRATVEEGTVNEDPTLLLHRVMAHAPRVVGISVYIWNAARSYALAREIKRLLPGTVVVMGGPEVGYTAKEVLEEHGEVDYVLSGEGEYPFATLLRNVVTGSDLPVPGLCRRGAAGVLVSPPYLPEEIPPSPFLPEFFDRIGDRIAYLETSRGCPFRCAFCLSGRAGKTRFFPLERAKRELLALAAAGVKTVKLVDRTFNAAPARAAEFFRFVAEEHRTGALQNTRVHFEIAADLLEEETMAALAEMPPGAAQLEIGLQSYHPETLRAIRRKTDTSKWEASVSALIGQGNLPVHVDLIAGLPFEDLETFSMGFDRAFRLGAGMLQLGFLKLIPGCAMREEPERFPCVYDPAPPYEVRETPWMSRADLALLHDCEEGLERLWNRGHWRRTLDTVFSSCACRPFDFFTRFGQIYRQKKPADPKELAALLFDFCVSFSGCGVSDLRDAMLCDLLSCGSVGALPDALKTNEPQYPLCRRVLQARAAALFAAGIRAGAFVVRGGTTVAVSVFRAKDRNPVTGEYPVRFYPFEIWIQQEKEITL